MLHACVGMRVTRMATSADLRGHGTPIIVLLGALRGYIASDSYSRGHGRPPGFCVVLVVSL